MIRTRRELGSGAAAAGSRGEAIAFGLHEPSASPLAGAGVPDVDGWHSGVPARLLRTGWRERPAHARIASTHRKHTLHIVPALIVSTLCI